MKRLILLSILLLSLIAGGLNAQNRVTTYQGSLIDATSDLPMTGTVQMTFELYTSQTGGSQLWSEIQNVTLEKGFFNVYLGSVNPFPTNLDLSKSLWLQITVGNGSTYPRTPLTPSFSSMYADKAAIAGLADDVKDGVITLEKLADAAKNMGGDLTGTLPNPKIRKGAFLEAIEPGSITQEMLSPNVSTRPSGPASGDLTGWYPDPLIAPMAVKTDRIDDLAVTTEKIADAAVTAEKIANLAVYNNHITDNAIDTRNIVNSAVTTDKINDLAVTTAKINDLAVTTGKIADGAVTQAKLDPNVSAFPWGPAGGDLMGTYPDPTVDALYGVSLASPALLNGDVYMYNAVSNQWESTQAAGDVIGDYNDLTVTHLLNIPLSAQPTTPGEIYMFDGMSWIPAGSGGDVSGLYNNLQLNPDVVTTIELAPDAVITENILDLNVTNAKLAQNSVTSDKIVDGQVMTADIANGAIYDNHINALAAIQGVKVVPNFGAQNIITTGNVTATNSYFTNTTVTGITEVQGSISNSTGAVVVDDDLTVTGTLTTPAFSTTSITATNAAFTNLTVTNPIVGSMIGVLSDGAGIGTFTYDGSGNATVSVNIDGTTIGINGSDNLYLIDGSVTTAKIANLSVTNAKLSADAVTTDKILDGTIVSADISDGTIIPADVNLAVAGWDFTTLAQGGNPVLTTMTPFSGDVNGTYNNIQLNSNVVTNFELADNAVTTVEILNGTILTEDIAASQITNALMAANSINSANIIDGTIVLADMGANSVATGNIVDGTVLPADVDLAVAGWDFTTLAQGGNAVLTTITPFAGDVNGTYNNIQLNANVVTTAEIADNAVTTTEILNGTILTEDIALAQITNTLMAPNSVNSANIIDGQVLTVDIANLNVTTEKINDLAVTTEKINDLAVTTNKIANNAVDNTKIANLAVTANKISSAAQVAGQILKADGAGNVVWANDNELSLPFDTTFADNGAAMSIIRNGGNGPVYYAEVQNPGTGTGFEAYVAVGAVGDGILSSVNGSGNAVSGIVESTGNGLAGYFENANFANNAPALFATSVATAVPAFVVYQQTANFGEVSAAITNGNAGSGSALFLENNAAGFDQTPSNWVDNEDGTNGSATLVVSNLAHVTPGMSNEAVAIRTYGDIEANSAIRGTDLIALGSVIVGNPYETMFAAAILPPDAMSDNLNLAYNTRVWGDLTVDNDGFFGNDVNVTNSLNALNVNATNGSFTDLDVTNNLTSVNAEIGTLTVNGVSYLRGDIINDSGALPVAINDDLDVYGNAYATGDLTVDGNIFATTPGTTGFFDFVDVASNLDVWGTMTATEGGIVNDLTVGGLTTTNDLVVVNGATIATGNLTMPVGNINLTAGKVYSAATVVGDPNNTNTTKGYVDAADLAINVLNEPFITYSPSAKLTNEKVLVGGDGMNFDAATATMNIDNNATLAVTANQIGLNLANANTWTGTQTYGAAGNGLVVTNNAQFNGSVRFSPVTLNAAATRANLATEITNGKTVIIYSSTVPAERNVTSGSGLPVLAVGDAGRIVYLVNGDAVATLVVLGKNVQTSEAIALLWTGSAWVKFADGF